MINAKILLTYKHGQFGSEEIGSFPALSEAVKHISENAWEADPDELMTCAYLLRDETGRVAATASYCTFLTNDPPTLVWMYTDGGVREFVNPPEDFGKEAA